MPHTQEWWRNWSMNQADSKEQSRETAGMTLGRKKCARAPSFLQHQHRKQHRHKMSQRRNPQQQQKQKSRSEKWDRGREEEGGGRVERREGRVAG